MCGGALQSSFPLEGQRMSMSMARSSGCCSSCLVCQAPLGFVVCGDVPDAHALKSMQCIPSKTISPPQCYNRVWKSFIKSGLASRLEGDDRLKNVALLIRT